MPPSVISALDSLAAYRADQARPRGIRREAGRAIQALPGEAEGAESRE